MKNKFVSLFIKKDLITESEEIKLGNLFIAIVFLWIASGIALFFYKDRGTFGDMFGSINTLFSGLAFGGIIYTIYQQRAEFKLQREELILQRQEVAQTNKELGEQVVNIKIQRFETSFFNMLTLHHEIVRSAFLEDTIKSGNTKISAGILLPEYKDVMHNGRGVFFFLNKRYDIEFSNKLVEYKLNNDFSYTNILSVIAVLENTSDDFFDAYNSELGHYLRNFSTIIELIDELENVEVVEKYIHILKAQLSAYELVIMFYSCFAQEYKQLKHNIKKYNLLDNLNGNLLSHPDAFKKAYNDLNY